MKKVLFTIIVVLFLLTACKPVADLKEAAGDAPTLLVTVGDKKESFSTDELKTLPASEATFKDVTYQGVTISALLDALSVQPDEVKAFKAVASDGYSVNYDPIQVLKANVVVAYAMADGSPLMAEDGNFRMVLPDEEGKLNLRMLAELQIIK